MGETEGGVCCEGFSTLLSPEPLLNGLKWSYKIALLEVKTARETESVSENQLSLVFWQKDKSFVMSGRKNLPLL